MMTAGEAVHDAGQLGEADDLAVPGNIGDMGHADEGQQVMLAHGVERDVPHGDHLVAAGLVEDLDMLGGVGGEAAENLGVHFSHTAGGLLYAGAVGVLPDGQQDFPDGGFDSLQVHFHQPYFYRRYDTL